MQQMLREIEQHNIDDDFIERSSGNASFEYTNLYRILCRPTHAHMSTLGLSKPDSLLHHAVIGVILADRLLLHAFCHVAAENKPEEVEVVDRYMIELIKGCKEVCYE